MRGSMCKVVAAAEVVLMRFPLQPARQPQSTTAVQQPFGTMPPGRLGPSPAWKRLPRPAATRAPQTQGRTQCLCSSCCPAAGGGGARAAGKRPPLAAPTEPASWDAMQTPPAADRLPQRLPPRCCCRGCVRCWRGGRGCCLRWRCRPRCCCCCWPAGCWWLVPPPQLPALPAAVLAAAVAA